MPQRAPLVPPTWRDKGAMQQRFPAVPGAETTIGGSRARRRRLSRKATAGYLFVAPAVIFLLIFSLLPFITERRRQTDRDVQETLQLKRALRTAIDGVATLVFKDEPHRRGLAVESQGPGRPRTVKLVRQRIFPLKPREDRGLRLFGKRSQDQDRGRTVR